MHWRDCRLRPGAYAGSAALRALYASDPLFFSHAHWGAAAGAGAVETVRRTLGGRGYMVSRAAISAGTDVIPSAALRWVMVSLTPVDDITATIVEGRNVGIAIACAMAVAACALCGAVLFVLLRPLGALAELMGRAALLRDDALLAAVAAGGPTKAGGATPHTNNNNSSRSSLREVALLQRAFGDLSAQLLRAKSFLPAALLAQLEGSGDEEEAYDDDEGDQNEDDCADDEVINIDGDQSVSSSVVSYTPYGHQPAQKFSRINRVGGAANESASSSRASSVKGSPQTSNLGLGLSPSAYPLATTARRYDRYQRSSANERNKKRRLQADHRSNPSTAATKTSASGAWTNADGTAVSSSLARSGVAPRMREIVTGGGLSHRGVSVAMVNLRQFHRAALQPHSALERAYASLVEAVGAAARDHKGILDAFHGDRFTLTFNAARPCATHATMAASAVLTLIAYLSDGQSFFSVTGNPSHIAGGPRAQVHIAATDAHNEVKAERTDSLPAAGRCLVSSSSAPCTPILNTVRVGTPQAAFGSPPSPTRDPSAVMDRTDSTARVHHCHQHDDKSGGGLLGTAVGDRAIPPTVAAGVVARAPSKREAPPNPRRARDAFPPTLVTSGVATGRCLVGNLGSATARRFTCVGLAVTHAAALERLCRRYPNTPCLLTGAAAAECETAIGTLCMDSVPLPAAPPARGSRHVTIVAAKYIRPNSTATAVGSSSVNIGGGSSAAPLDLLQMLAVGGPPPPVPAATGAAAPTGGHRAAPTLDGDGEWMYELMDAAEKCGYRSGNLAFGCALAGDAEGAARHLASFTDDSEEAEHLRRTIATMLQR